jgi:microcystin-dependent protein
MSAPFVAEIRPFACNFAPRGWAMCQGQLLQISQNTALFSLVGTFYGGNGTSNFALPDLRSRVPIKYGTDPVGNQYDVGQAAGEENIQLSSSQMPVHTHNVFGTSSIGKKATPVAGCALGTSNHAGAFYAPGNTANTSLNTGTVSTYPGSGLPHTNLQPYLAINWCIALQGIFPARN